MNEHMNVTLMIADDESFILRGLKEIVSDSDLPLKLIGTAGNGMDAFALLLSSSPDIAIMDIRMPGMDGLEVIRRARDAGLTTHFLILSGYNDFSYAQEAIRYNVHGYFLKPLNIPEFRQALSAEYQDVLATRAKSASDTISTDELSSLMESSRSYFLAQLLQGEISSADVTNARLNFLHINLGPDSSVAVILTPENSDSDFETDFASIITHTIHPVLKTFFYEAFLYQEQQIVCIINLSAGNEDLLLARIKACLTGLQKKNGLSFLAAVGTIVPELCQCSASYQAALSALSYRIYVTDTKIFDSGIICHQLPQESPRSIDSAPLADAILNGDTTRIKDYCSAFFDSLFFVRMPPPNYIFGMFLFLISNVQKDIAIKSSHPVSFPEFTFDDLNILPSVSELKDWLIDFFLNYSELLTASHNGHDQIIRQAKEYIRSHLDCNIKAKDVAALVGLSEAYFTIYFKNHSGVNFRDYILSEKMEYAKSLICAQNCSITEIAYQIGYQDYRSFSRAFKNTVGMSPSEYLNAASKNTSP